MSLRELPAVALLFDMDGVLVDSTAAVESHWSQWAERRGLDAADVLRSAHGSPTRAVIARFTSEPEIDVEADWVEQLGVDNPDDVALPGAFAALSQRHLPVAVVTSATHALAELRLGRAGLPVPAVLVGADDVQAGKPDPEPYLQAAARLGVDPARCVGVEDAPIGLVALRAAGVAPLAVLTTFRAGELAALGHLADLSALTIEPGRVRWTSST